jgi:hypothetical protein
LFGLRIDKKWKIAKIEIQTAVRESAVRAVARWMPPLTPLIGLQVFQVTTRIPIL